MSFASQQLPTCITLGWGGGGWKGVRYKERGNHWPPQIGKVRFYKSEMRRRQNRLALISKTR